MTENTGARPTRRMVKRQRAVRLLPLRTHPAVRTILRQSPSTIAIAVGVAFGFATLSIRGIVVPLDHPRIASAEIAYNAASLRPELEAPDETRIPDPSMYTVVDGDTLLSIAYRYGSTVEAISLASHLPNTTMLKIGQQLTIPPARSTLQTVAPDTSMEDLAASYGVDPAVLTAYNGIDAPVSAPIDRNVIVLPPGPIDTSAPMLASARTTKPSGAGDGYKVADGDTVSTIAEKLGVDTKTLVAANHLSDSDRIVVGQTLWSDTAHDGDITVKAASLGASAASERIKPPTPTTYEVAPGDTVEGLADRFGLDTWTIIHNNGIDIADQDTISVGEQLTILPVSGLMYTVEPGDTLAGIAERYHVDLGPIIDFNYLDDLDHISVGMDLILPGASPLPPAPVAAPSSAAQGPSKYTVVPGDTLFSIAKRFGVEPGDIIVANKLSSADRLSIGEELRIEPGAGGSSNSTSASASTSASGSSGQTVTRNLPVPSASSSAALRPSSGGGGVSSMALDYKGYRYVWGGTTPAGFDCSGFVYYIYSKAGSPISRGMWGQYNAGAHPSRGDLQPGDIVFFQNTYMPGLSHDGIYIGNGQFIHASDERTGVTISSLSESYWASHWFGATRVN